MGDRAVRVLLVEDDAPIRNVARRVLANAGFEVAIAANGSEALDYIRANAGGVDVVLSDILMPIMDGVELAVRARAEFPHVRFVFMTGFADISHDQERAAGLCEAILGKPFDVRELVAAIRRAAGA